MVSMGPMSLCGAAGQALTPGSRYQGTECGRCWASGCSLGTPGGCPGMGSVNTSY